MKMDFKCTMCSLCCRGEHMEMRAAGRKTTLEDWGLSLKENGDCINLADDGTCKIYDNRPLICNVEDFYDRREEIKDKEPGAYSYFQIFSKPEYYANLHK